MPFGNIRRRKLFLLPLVKDNKKGDRITERIDWNKVINGIKSIVLSYFMSRVNISVFPLNMPKAII